ncbi:MAG: hypothetical protein Q9218_006218 [Villophora microphyllina]
MTSHKTPEEIVSTLAIGNDGPGECCCLCKKPYDSFIRNELPLTLPCCGHTGGLACVLYYIHDGNHPRCPVCQKNMLDHETCTHAHSLHLAAMHAAREREVNEEQVRQDQECADRYDLRHWHPAWDAQSNHFDRPTRFALRGEELFQELCVYIVRYIEDPTLSSADEWVRVRVPYRHIIALATFENFAEVMMEELPEGDPMQQWLMGDPSNDLQHLRRMMDALPALAGDHKVFKELEDMAKQILDYRTVYGGRVEFVQSDERTCRRLGGWFARITKSRDALYQRLYSVRRQSVSE